MNFKADLLSTDDPRKIYINQVEIGQGSSGTVSVATDLRTQSEVAVKKMTLAKGVNQVQILRAELMIMRLSQHKNIVTYVDSYISGNSLWCVMEYINGVDLTEIIRCSRALLTERLIAVILREILEGVNFLHTSLYPIVHRDLKSDNILLSMDGNVKISKLKKYILFFYFSNTLLFFS
jgi:p21-activated kinase 1